MENSSILVLGAPEYEGPAIISSAIVTPAEANEVLVKVPPPLLPDADAKLSVNGLYGPAVSIPETGVEAEDDDEPMPVSGAAGGKAGVCAIRVPVVAVGAPPEA